MARTDLHTHSTASDGELAPAALVAAAAREGLATIALTDHDGMAGCIEAVAAGGRLGVRVLPGIELSVRFPTGQFHLLGWFARIEPQPLAGRLAALGAERSRRNRAMLDRLRLLGIDVREDDLRGYAGGRVGRAQMADALVRAGHVADREQAFARYLGEGAPAYVPLGPLDPAEAIEIVRASGGVSCLAHPRTLRLCDAALDALLGELAAAGLDAVEVHRGDTPAEAQRALAAFAGRHGLRPSGGSDYHGPGHEARARRLGETGEPGVDERDLDALVALVDERDLSRRRA